MSTTTLSVASTSWVPSSDLKIPGLLLAHAPVGSTGIDRYQLEGKFVVGRSSACNLSIKDPRLSSKHFRILREGTECLIEDLQSTNGTFVGGLPVKAQLLLSDQDIIRAGQSVMVFHKDVGSLMVAPHAERYGMAGKFHTNAFLQELREAATSGRHILLAGETGTGKELAARALAAMMGKPHSPRELLVYNGGRFASREEAISTLFGVAPRFFSGVDPRVGMIEQADGKVLFLDEIHNLPEESQRMFLRVVEDGATARLGESTVRQISTRFVVASNVSGETSGLARDLFARLRMIELLPIRKRLADIPGIFDGLLNAALARKSIEIDDLSAILQADHYEAMCLADFGVANIRALVDLIDRIVTRISTGIDPAKAVAQIFAKYFPNSHVNTRHRGSRSELGTSHYEKNRTLILATYRECQGNLSMTIRELKARGMKCSRRWLSVFLKKWGAR